MPRARAAFSWHGSVRDGKGSKTGYVGDVKVPHALNFQVLRCMPDQMYLVQRRRAPNLTSLPCLC